MYRNGAMVLKEIQTQVQTLVQDIEMLKNQNATIVQSANSMAINGTNPSNTMLWNRSSIPNASEDQPDCTVIQMSTRSQKKKLHE